MYLKNEKLGLQFDSLPSLVQSEVVHNFIENSSGIKPDFMMVRRIIELTRMSTDLSNGDNDRIHAAPKGNMIHKSISISKELEVRKFISKVGRKN